MNKEIGSSIRQNNFSNLEQSRLEIALSNLSLSLKKELWKSVYELEKKDNKLNEKERDYKIFVIRNKRKREETYQRISELAKITKLLSKNYTKN